MKVLKIVNKILKYVIFISIFFMLIGITYSFFVAGLTGVETDTTITMDSGNMDIVYSSGPAINATGLAPSDTSFGTKNFTITGTSTIDLSEMNYKISLVIDENTLSKNAISFKLTSTNTSGNGMVVPSIEEDIYVGTNNIELGIGKFIGPVNNAVHTYQMKFYFYETNTDQSNDINKNFKAHVSIESYNNPCVTGECLKDKILAQGGGAAAIEAKGNPNFTVISTESDTGLYAMEDEYGTSYYYRGNKNILNNNLIFGEFQWKIIRINGDGSIRIMYNGTKEQFNQNDTMNDIGEETVLGFYSYSSIYNDNKYVGYMYGGPKGVASTQRHGFTSSAATFNETDSDAKEQLDLWYKQSFLDKTFENKIADNLFCNDRQFVEEILGKNIKDPGYGQFYASYAPRYRIYTAKTPTLKCKQQNDQFTVTKRSLGNGSLKYPVGLITIDEVMMAGLIYGTQNVDSYLFVELPFHTMSPYAFFDGSAEATIWGVGYHANISGNLVTRTIEYDSLRPVINLKSDVVVTGEGTLTNPYQVID